jgi:hypothetical protein
VPELQESFLGIKLDVAIQSMFRAMIAELDGYPKMGRSSRTLGVRIDGPNRDILIAQDGTVSPSTGGMSVALDAAQNLPKHRLPKSLGGEGRDPVFKMLSASLPVRLFVRPDRYPHGCVEPAAVCLFEQYEKNIWATRLSWSNRND